MASLNHIHLHARDLAASRRLHESWFGFREHCWQGEILFLRDDPDLVFFRVQDPAVVPVDVTWE